MDLTFRGQNNDGVGSWSWTPHKNNKLDYYPKAGAWSISDNVAMYAGAFLSSDGGINAEVIIPIDIATVNTQTLKLRLSKGSDFGIATIQLDTTAQTTLDCYAAGATQDFFTSVSITPPHTGLNFLRFKLASKNAASSSYFFYLQAAWLEEV